MNDSGDQTIWVSHENFGIYCGIAIVHEESIFVRFEGVPLPTNLRPQKRSTKNELSCMLLAT